MQINSNGSRIYGSHMTGSVYYGDELRRMLARLADAYSTPAPDRLWFVRVLQFAIPLAVLLGLGIAAVIDGWPL